MTFVKKSVTKEEKLIPSGLDECIRKYNLSFNQNETKFDETL